MATAQEQQDLLTIRQVARKLSLSPRTLYRLIASGKLPEPIKLSSKLVRFRASDIAKYIATL